MYAQIDAVRERQLITDSQAHQLAAHYTTPAMEAIYNRLVRRRVDHHEVDQITAELDRLHAERRITDRQVRPIRDLLGRIPSPEHVAKQSAQRQQRFVQREQLISELVALRKTGAINETELQAEITRLRAT